MSKIKGGDIIEKNYLENAIQQAKELEKAYEVLDIQVKNLSINTKKSTVFFCITLFGIHIVKISRHK